jgi:Rrf2 family iron-sulfur cluster assembly transcriptional regulator
MKLFNTSLNYTLKVIVHLAKCPDDGFTLSAEIAKQEKIPAHFLAEMLQKLVNLGVVETVNGRDGGFRITELGLNSTMKDIFLNLYGITDDNACILDEYQCSENGTCLLHVLRTNIIRYINDNLLTIKIKELVIR